MSRKDPSDSLTRLWFGLTPVLPDLPTWAPEVVVLGGSLSEVTIGPVCKIRGEVESSVILGYTNKAHDGFLGHAYLGRWVNLGAFTTNSDLKNNYGPVRMGSPGGPVDTGLMKVGCFLGDHVKTGIGTLLNTGTVVGAGSNIFGGGMPPTYVPPFSWGSGDDLTEFRLDKFLEVASGAMGRRGMELDEDMEAVLRRAWEPSSEATNVPRGHEGLRPRKRKQGKLHSRSGRRYSRPGGRGFQRQGP